MWCHILSGLMSWLVNFVISLISFQFSPCIQGCVLGFALVFKIPILVVPYNATTQLFKIRLQLLNSIMHSCSWPLRLILVCFHPYAPNNSYHYVTNDTLLLLLSGNLLIATPASRYYFCFNFECGGVSCALLNFQGTGQFSVQLQPLP